MDRKFTLSCCSTVDLPYSYMESRDIPVLFYTYVVDGREYDDDMGRDPEALPRFYTFLKEGKLPQTSQINVAAYTEFFEKLLDKGGDVLHIAFTSGQSGSVHNAFLAAEELKDRYPGQRLVVIDSLCSSSGYGLLVDYAADMRDEGKTLDEVAQWVLDNRNKVHHQFFSSDMTQFHRTGRVSGAAAAVATVLNICPIMRLNDEGRIIAYDKVRGRANAVKETIRVMRNHVQDGVNYSGKCLICHSDDPVDGERARAEICAEFPKADVHLLKIGTIIGAHCGPGTVAVFFLGDQRTHEDPK